MSWRKTHAHRSPLSPGCAIWTTTGSAAGENFFWGHYFTDKDEAQKDLASRVDGERGHLAERRPSLLERLKRGQAKVAKRPGRDAPEKPRGEMER